MGAISIFLNQTAGERRCVWLYTRSKKSTRVPKLSAATAHEEPPSHSTQTGEMNITSRNLGVGRHNKTPTGQTSMAQDHHRQQSDRWHLGYRPWTEVVTDSSYPQK